MWDASLLQECFLVVPRNSSVQNISLNLLFSPFPFVPVVQNVQVFLIARRNNPTLSLSRLVCFLTAKDLIDKYSCDFKMKHIENWLGY